MILSEEEIINLCCERIRWTDDELIRAIESAILDKLKAQEPVGVFEMIDEAYDGKEYVHLYRHPIPADDVVRDAARLEWLMSSGRMVICDKEGCYTYTHTSGRYGPVAKTKREAIDKAMGETK